ncbi:MAG TPA: SGNH/GDSL hydrolase family protein [Gammaproteobacteria bacterium]|nr:SGNH/GDSL hydrolase family protein [Gammaproteobacteria bacterium]
MKNRPSLLLILLLWVSAVSAQQSEWIGTWGASPLPPSAANGPFPGSPTFMNQTVRQIVRISAGGDRVRLRLSNEYGSRPLVVGAARIAIVDDKGAIKAGTERAVTFGGKPSVTIPSGAPFVSDAIDLAVQPLASLSISLYFPEDTGPCTCHATGMQTAYVSMPGDFTSGAFEPAQTIQSRAFLSGVEVATRGPAHVVVVLGDSISDGVGSTVNENRRWPDNLAARLVERRGRGAWGVVNEGISGNRVLSDGAGESALTRFDRDVLAVPGATHVVVFEGVNDIGIAFGARRPGFNLPAGPELTADSMIMGYRQIIARAHEHGLKVYGATIAPYEGAAYYSDKGEAVRSAVNDWIRKGGEFDGVIDFDAVLRDPNHPTQIEASLHAGDHLHGSDAGYRKMADAIDLDLFR